MIQRKIKKVVNHRFAPGFLGQGHQAAAVVNGRDFVNTDPLSL